MIKLLKRLFTRVPVDARAGHVAEAARVLDAKRPGWAGRVDIQTLSMLSLTHCVLGQVFAHETISNPWLGYTHGLYAIDPNHRLVQGVFASPQYKPFWVREIRQRQGQPVVA